MSEPRPHEVSDTFACFGSTCAVSVIGDSEERSAREAVEAARAALLEWHERFSRFSDRSELSALNRSAEPVVRVSPLMAQLAGAVVRAASLTGGLVDATQVEEIERAGYRAELADPLPLQIALSLAPPRRSAGTRANAAWPLIHVDPTARTVARPPGVKIDSGGLAKGLFADVLGDELASHPAFAVNCGGDLLIGGSDYYARPLTVESPFDGSVLHTFDVSHAGVATSGIGRRSWLDAAGRPAHHLLDPATGSPAFTGVVQATALAPTALLAEIRAKAAILAGPRAAARWLPDGGVIVLDDGSHHSYEPPATVTLSALSASAQHG